MDKIRQALQGWKTYLVAAGAIIAVAISWAEGTVPTDEAVKLLTAAVLACTIRAGVAKAPTP